MSHPPSTPVKVPGSAATYTPATLDPELRSQINSALLRDGHIAKLQDQLLHSLDANSSNWPSAVQKHAVSLLRNGEVSTFPALIRRVLEDVRHDTANNASNPTAATDSSNGAVATDKNGTTETNGVNGNKKAGVNGVNSSSADATNLAIPPAVLETVLKLARESLEAVCSIEDGGGPATNGN